KVDLAAAEALARLTKPAPSSARRRAAGGLGDRRQVHVLALERGFERGHAVGGLDPLDRLAGRVEPRIGVSGHLTQPSSAVTRMTSSMVVRPERTFCAPSSRRVRRPCSIAACL